MNRVEYYYKTYIDWSTIEEQHAELKNETVYWLLRLTREQIEYVLDFDLKHDYLELVQKIYKSCYSKGTLSLQQYKTIRIFLSQVINHRRSLIKEN